MEKSKLLKISIIITDIFFALLLILAVLLPFLVTWYVETMGRSKSLAATILVTCYPCVPFAAVALFSLRKFLFLVAKNLLFGEKSVKYMKNMAVCCIVIAVITVIAGKFYLPFLIVGAAMSFIALLTFSFRAVLLYETDKKEKNDNEILP